MSSAGLNIDDLKQRIEKDIAASNELQQHIDQLREDIAAGKSIDDNEIALMGVEHKQIGRDLVARIEQIENQAKLDAADRNMLQALTARLSVHDLQSARIAEFGDLRTPKEFLEGEQAPQITKMPSRPVLETSDSHELVAGSWSDSLDREGGTVEVDEDSDDDDSYEIVENDDEEEAEIDKSTWPLLYRILDVDPSTPDYLFNDELNRSYKALALKHDPARFPNDPSAPERWAACNKAYAMLSDPDRKKFYDLHLNMPKDLQDFDLSKLRLEE